MQIYQLTRHHVSSDLEGEHIILDHKAGKYYGLNETGSLVWEMLQKSPLDFNALKKGITEAYDIDEQQCNDDLVELMQELIHENLVEAL